MKPVVVLYWLRFFLGIVAAVVCIGYGIATNTITAEPQSSNILVTGFSLAVIVYILSYWIMKPIFLPKMMDKPNKILTTGIFLYFFTWLVLWILLYTLLVTA